MKRFTQALSVVFMGSMIAGCQSAATSYSVSARVTCGEQADTYMIAVMVTEVAQDGTESVLTTPTMVVRSNQPAEVVVSASDETQVRVHGRVIGDGQQAEAELGAEVLNGRRSVWKSNVVLAIDTHAG